MESTSTAVHLPFDLSKGQWIVAIPRSEDEAVAVLTVQQLLSLVPDPVASEKPQRVSEDPRLAEYAELRKEVQRAVQGAKARNATKFGDYLVEGLVGRRPWMVPAITLYHPDQLQQVPLGNGVVALCLPFGDFFVAIDGETQRIAWQFASREYSKALGTTVKVVIHHGKPMNDARQGFSDLNTREVKPSAAVAIAMDSQDFATKVTRRIIEESDVLRDKVNMQRRQLRRTDTDLLTISALRTGVVTTILGTAGLQVGSRPIPALPSETNREEVESATVEVWTAIAEALEDELQPSRRPFSVVSAPSVLAGIGAVAHHTMPVPPRDEDMTSMSIEQVLDLLDGVVWDRGDDQTSVWDGIAGKFSAAGSFAVGGPKEVGHMIAEALFEISSESGKRIRGAKL